MAYRRLILFVLMCVVPLSFSNLPRDLRDIFQNSNEIQGGSDFVVYLPVFDKPEPPKGIYGFVWEQFHPLSNIFLELRYYDGVTWSTIATTTTDVNGMYSFLNVPSLQSGQRYYVLFRGPNTGLYMDIWATPILVAYQSGQEIHLSDFDVSGIFTYLISDAQLPYTFDWGVRPAATGESYELDIYDNDLDPYFYTPPLGYVGSYTLTELPEHFTYNHWYLWEIWVYSPDGGLGISRYSGVWFVPNGIDNDWGREFSLPEKQYDESYYLHKLSIWEP